MSGRKDRDKARGHARHLHTKHGQTFCPNCGLRGAHFVPPSLGEPGFFTCTPRISTKAEALDQMGDGQALVKMREIKDKEAASR